MKEGRGKKDYQPMKPYIIYNYLMRNSACDLSRWQTPLCDPKMSPSGGLCV